jgi:prefoldin subunit 5
MNDIKASLRDVVKNLSQEETMLQEQMDALNQRMYKLEEARSRVNEALVLIHQSEGEV